MEKSTLGSKLIALRERSGLSLANLAKAAGYRNASSIQRYFTPEYDAEHLSPALAKRLTNALVGFGDPPITEADLFKLEKYGFYMDRQFQPAADRPIDLTRRRTDFIVVHSAVETGLYVGEAESFVVIKDPVLFFDKPEHLNHRLIEGVMVCVDSMDPRYKAGDVIFYDSDIPAAPGQDVLVWTSVARPPAEMLEDTPSNQLGDAILVRLVRRTRTTLTFATHAPAAEFEVDRADVDAVYPILGLLDFLPQKSEQAVYPKA